MPVRSRCWKTQNAKLWNDANYTATELLNNISIRNAAEITASLLSTHASSHRSQFSYTACKPKLKNSKIKSSCVCKPCSYNSYREFVIYSSSDDAQCVRRQTATSNGNHRGLLNAYCTAQRRVDIHDGVMLMFPGARVLYQPLQSYICVTNNTVSRSDKEYQTKTYRVPRMQQILNPLTPQFPHQSVPRP